MRDYEQIYLSGKVTRYHANPRFNRFLQTDADHSWGCAALLFMLHPDPSLELIKAAIFHDCGELWSGDLPHPFKVAEPELAAQHGAIESRLARENGVPEYQLTGKEKKWLKLVDRLESLLYCRLHYGDSYREDFQDNNDQVIELAEELGADLEGIV